MATTPTEMSATTHSFTCRDIAVEIVRLGTQYPKAVYRSIEMPDGPACMYTKGRPKHGPAEVCGCLIGQAIINCSGPYEYVIRKQLKAYDNKHSIPNSEEVMAWLHKRFPTVLIDHDAKLSVLIRAVQSEQDRKKFWSRCIEKLQQYLAEDDVQKYLNESPAYEGEADSAAEAG